MRVIIVAIGREVNAPYDGYKVANGRKAWLLHEEDWKQFQRDTQAILLRIGAVLFSGQTRGFNTETQEEEESYTVAVDYDAPEVRGLAGIQDAMAELGKRYGQKSIGFIDGESELLPCD